MSKPSQNPGLGWRDWVLQPLRWSRAASIAELSQSQAMTDEIRDLKNALGRLSADLCVLTIQVSENLAMTDLRTEAMQAEIDMLRLDCAEIKQELRDLAASAAQAQAAAEGIASATALLRSLHRAGLDAAEQARS